MRHGLEAKSLVNLSVLLSLYYRERQSDSLHGYMSLVAGLQAYVALHQAMLLQKH